MIAAPADKRFRRAQVKPGRRAWWRVAGWKGARAAVICGALAYGAYHAAEVVFSSELLKVNDIALSGDIRMSRGAVLTLLEELRGVNMLTMDIERWRQTVRSSPWVADVAMRRMLPGTVAVVVSERRPIAIGRFGDALFLIDHGGDIIDELVPSYTEFDLPIVDGLDAGARAGETMVDTARAALLTNLLADVQGTQALAGRISQVNVSDARDAVVILEGDTALVHLGDQRFEERLQTYLDLAPALRDRVPDIDYVDLRFDDRVYVRPHASKRRPRAAVPAPSARRGRAAGGE